MNLNITLDFGSIWDMLTAIGTVGSVVVALWLAKKENTVKLSYEVEGLNYGHIYLTTEDKKKRVIRFYITNHNNFDIKISTIGVSVLKRKPLPLFKKSQRYLSKSKKKNMVSFIGDSSLNSESKLPFTISTRESGAFYYPKDNFDELINYDKPVHLVFTVRDSQGNRSQQYAKMVK